MQRIRETRKELASGVRCLFGLCCKKVAKVWLLVSSLGATKKIRLSRLVPALLHLLFI
jgi:hypothetical protein